jgi:hypothetical protein
MKRITILLAALVAGAVVGHPGAAAAQTLATAGAGGTYPSGTTFVGVNIQALQVGVGSEVNQDGSGLGQFTAILVGLSALGADQFVTIEGQVTGGSRPSANVAILTGTSTVNLGDGTPEIPGVAFTATLTSGANGLGTVVLSVTGFADLPNATLNAGSLTIQ